MGRLAEARPLYERVLRGDEAELGPTHPHTLDSIYNLGRLCQAEGHLEDAVALYRRELEGCASQYGAEHQETRSSASNLHGLLMQMGRADDASAIARRFGLSERARPRS